MISSAGSKSLVYLFSQGEHCFLKSKARQTDRGQIKLFQYVRLLDTVSLSPPLMRNKHQIARPRDERTRKDQEVKIKYQLKQKAWKLPQDLQVMDRWMAGWGAANKQEESL